MQPTNNTADIAELQKQIADLQSKLANNASTEINTATTINNASKEENLLYKWTAPTRLYFKRDKLWYWTILFIFLIVCVVLLYMKEFPMILAVLSLLFVLYATSLIPPENAEHQITTVGIRTLGDLYTWETLKDFWISKKFALGVVDLSNQLCCPKLTKVVDRMKTRSMMIFFLIAILLNIFKIYCLLFLCYKLKIPNFPKNKSNKSYFKIKNIFKENKIIRTI